MITRRQYQGGPAEGVIHQMPQRVMTPARGIIFDRPERYVVNTPVGQLEIYPGDWIVEFVPGRLYVIRAEDMAATPQPKQSKVWWKLWSKI